MYIFIALLVTTSILLIILKRHVPSLALSSLAATLIMFVLIPIEEFDVKTNVNPYGGIDISTPTTPPISTGNTSPTTPPTTTPPTTTPPITTPPITTPPATTPLIDGMPVVAELAQDYLPSCATPTNPRSNKEIRDYIRNNGLYGVHGDVNCRKMQRASVADKGLLQPLNARNQLLHFLSVDQLHAKDSTLIPRQRIPVT